MPETVLATFRIDKRRWEAFKAKTGNASQALCLYVESVISDPRNQDYDDVIVTRENVVEHVQFLSDYINDTQDRKIRELYEKVERLQKILDATIRNYDERVGELEEKVFVESDKEGTGI